MCAPSMLPMEAKCIMMVQPANLIIHSQDIIVIFCFHFLMRNLHCFLQPNDFTSYVVIS